MQQRRLGEPISRSSICEKASILNKKVGGDPHFKAMIDDRQAAKNGIHQLDIQVKNFLLILKVLIVLRNKFLLIIK